MVIFAHDVDVGKKTANVCSVLHVIVGLLSAPAYIVIGLL